MAKKATAKKKVAKKAKKATKAKKVTKASSATSAKKVKKAARKVAKKAVKKATKKTTKKVARKTVKAKKVTTAKKGAKKSASKKVKKNTAKKALKKTSLTKKELGEFRGMLLDKRRAIVGDMNGISAGALGVNRQNSGDLSNMPTHPADIGTDNYEHEFSLGLLESERALLGEIDEALERVDNKSYGICLGTGEAINKARLRARPWSKYCIEYARMIEKGLIRPGSEPDEEQLEEDE